MKFVLLFSLFVLGEARPVDNIEHIIIFMQENRAFDHYFGSMKGVRGFNDRVVVPLRSGLSVFYQPTDQADMSKYMLPFRVDIQTTSAMCMDAPTMNYECDMNIWNNGKYDSWNTARSPGMGMSYFSREDLPYYYELYDNFATGDQYFQSTYTATNPNRMHLFTGSNGLSVGQPAVLDNSEPRPGYNWTTMGQILEEKNISWRVYQQINNFDDNAFAWFNSFQQSRPGDDIFDKGLSRSLSLIEAFEKDLAAGTLPQVSWIIAPSWRSEHASHHPSVGEAFTARILQKLEKYPSVYAKSVFILNYDEGGQFYDHSWAPSPPLSETDGMSTVSTEGEINTEVMTDVPAPIGMGFRVPLLIISPWTRGNIVISEVYDHTSVIKLIETRFNVTCPNISPWRRAMTGDMTASFDFDHPDYSWPDLPDTKEYTEESIDQCQNLPYPVVPEEQTFPVQEEGVRISRALPYEFVTSDSVDFTSRKLVILLENTGAGGAPFTAFDMKNLENSIPQKYAVESGKSINASFSIAAQDYGVLLLGPNGFFRQFYGTDQCTRLSASLFYQPEDGSVLLSASNGGTDNITVVIEDNAYDSGEPVELSISGGLTVEYAWKVSASGNWYDLTLSAKSSDCFSRRFGGRMETGKDSISDPAMAYIVTDVVGIRAPRPTVHPKIPSEFRHISRKMGSPEMATHKDELWEFVVPEETY